LYICSLNQEGYLKQLGRGDDPHINATRTANLYPLLSPLPEEII
jgi:hypothetical protein